MYKGQSYQYWEIKEGLWVEWNLVQKENMPETEKPSRSLLQ